MAKNAERFSELLESIRYVQQKTIRNEIAQETGWFATSKDDVGVAKRGTVLQEIRPGELVSKPAISR